MADEAKTGTTTDDGKRRATTGKTTGKTTPPDATTTVPTATTASQPAAAVATTAPAAPKSTPPKPLPEPSPRSGVAVNVTSVATAFHGGGRARSVRAIQQALSARGFAPGNVDGLVDYGTRAAYAKFQQSVDERPTGVPTDYSLDVLGFDVVG